MKRVLLFLLCLTSSLIARPEAWLETGLITPEMIVSVKTELGLSDEQVADMSALAEEVKGTGNPLEKKVRDEQKALAKLLRQPDTTADEGAAALSRLLEAEAAVKQLRLRTLLALRDQLTPEQQEKAVKLVPGRHVKRTGVEERVREKAMSLRTAVDALGVPPTQAMQERGEAVESLVRQGDLEAANQALDQLLADSDLDSSEPVEAIDFSKFSPGETDLQTLRQRYDSVESSAQSVVSIVLVKQLIQGKHALEEAKAAEDAEKVGRILTWAEEALK